MEPPPGCKEDLGHQEMAHSCDETPDQGDECSTSALG